MSFPRRLRWCLVVMCVALIAAVAIPFAASSLRADKPAPPPVPAIVPPPIAPLYSVEAGLDGEIFPALANYAALQRPRDRRLPTVTVRITNPSRELLKDRLSVQVPGWSDQEIQMVEVAPGETRSFHFGPTFLPRLFRNREIAAATVVVMADDAAGHTVFSATVPVRLRAAEDIYWGADFQFAPFIAAWVTPHDPRIEAVLSRAKEYMPGRRLPGYEDWKNTAAQVNSTYMQARAIYRALQAMGVSYVKSSLTFGRHQDISERVRLPRESLRQVSANCIDGAVMYASLFENLGMDPLVVLVPGHAYVGVREAEHSDHFIYLETALTGRTRSKTRCSAPAADWARFRPPRSSASASRRRAPRESIPCPSPAGPRRAWRTSRRGSGRSAVRSQHSAVRVRIVGYPQA
jgi:hypothetical protein